MTPNPLEPGRGPDDPFRMIAGPPEKGDCFSVAYRLLLALNMPDLLEVLQCRGVTMVHGVPLGAPGSPIEGIRFAHAWIEMIHPDHGPVVMDYSSGHSLIAKRTIYYRVGAIEPGDCRRYDPDDAIAFAEAWGDLGPWEEPVLDAALFNPDGEVVPTSEKFKAYPAGAYVL